MLYFLYLCIYFTVKKAEFLTLLKTDTKTCTSLQMCKFGLVIMVGKSTDAGRSEGKG